MERRSRKVFADFGSSRPGSAVVDPGMGSLPAWLYDHDAAYVTNLDGSLTDVNINDDGHSYVTTTPGIEAAVNQMGVLDFTYGTNDWPLVLAGWNASTGAGYGGWLHPTAGVKTARYAAFAFAAQFGAAGAVVPVNGTRYKLWFSRYWDGATNQLKVWLTPYNQPTNVLASSTGTDATISASGLTGFTFRQHGGGTKVWGFEDYVLGTFGTYAAGWAWLDTTTDTTATLMTTLPEAGTGPFTYQWYLSTTTGFTPGVGTLVSGATASVYTTAALQAGVTYFAKCITTDTGAANATVTSNEVAIQVDPGAALNIGVLSDSTWALESSDNSAHPVGTTADFLKRHLAQMTGRKVNVYNYAVNGKAWADFQPGQALFDNAKADMIAKGVTLCVAEFGINDAGNNTVAATFQSQAQTSVNSLYAAGIVTVMNYPQWFLPTSFSGRAFAIPTLLTYLPMIDGMTDGVKVIRGNRDFGRRMRRESLVKDSLHGNEAGCSHNAMMTALALTNYLDVTNDHANLIAIRTVTDSLALDSAGRIGIDWSNIGQSSENVILPNTTIGHVTELTAGSGNVIVDHDYGGVDNLRVLESGVPVDDARLEAFVATDYIAGTRNVVAQAYTGSDGRWISPMHLDNDSYKLVVSKPGVIQDKVVDLVVTV